MDGWAAERANIVERDEGTIGWRLVVRTNAAGWCGVYIVWVIYCWMRRVKLTVTASEVRGAVDDSEVEEAAAVRAQQLSWRCQVPDGGWLNVRRTFQRGGAQRGLLIQSGIAV